MSINEGDFEGLLWSSALIWYFRSLVVFGLPKFASAALIQLDPAPWTNIKLE